MPRYEVDHNYSRLRNIVRMQFLYFYLVHYYYYYYYYYYHYAASPCVGYSIYPIRGLLLLMNSCLAEGDCVYVWPVTLMSPAKTTELIQLSFGIWTRDGH